MLYKAYVINCIGKTNLYVLIKYLKIIMKSKVSAYKAS